MLNIETENIGDVASVRLEGEVDEDGGVRKLKESLVSCLKRKEYNTVVNLSGMEFISWMGIGVLVKRVRQFRSYDGDMKLVGLNLYTQRLFRMTGVTSLFDFYDTEVDAIREYRGAG